MLQSCLVIGSRNLFLKKFSRMNARTEELSYPAPTLFHSFFKNLTLSIPELTQFLNHPGVKWDFVK